MKQSTYLALIGAAAAQPGSPGTWDPNNGDMADIYQVANELPFTGDSPPSCYDPEQKLYTACAEGTCGYYSASVTGLGDTQAWFCTPQDNCGFKVGFIYGMNFFTDCIDQGRLDAAANGDDLNDMHESIYSQKVSGQQGFIDNFYRQAECIEEITFDSGDQTVFAQQTSKPGIRFLDIDEEMSGVDIVENYPGCEVEGGSDDEGERQSEEETDDDNTADGDAEGGEGEDGRGTIEENGECNHKEENMGCVLNFCCAIGESVDASGVDGLSEDDVKTAEEEAMKESDTAKEKGEGICLSDTETELEVDGMKFTYSCGASALAASALVFATTMINM